MTPDQVNVLLQVLQALQTGLLHALDAVGLAPHVEGQPAWPFARRIGAEQLRFDPGLARDTALSLAALAVALPMFAVGALWRRVRPYLLSAGALLLLAAPWPSAHLLGVPAVPTSFHAAQGGRSPAVLAEGRHLYARHCVGCHGADGDGQGPLAAALPMWPPNLNGPLLWQRLDGELFWRIGHGLRDRAGRETMPGFRGTLGAHEIWALIDYLQVRAAGEQLRRTGRWLWPVQPPAITAQCDDAPPRTLASLAGQRLRLVAAGPGADPPREDPRVVTVVLSRGAPVRDDIACHSDDAQAWDALALVAGVDPERLAGQQLIVDRDGFLRARGSGSWSEADLVCRADDRAAPLAPAAASGDGDLGRLIERIDAEPVRPTRGGFPHGG